MANIKFYALGGLGEIGKNMYITEVDDMIFVLDAGLKYPSVDLMGIDAVYPDMAYLEENSNRIQGLFLSHAHEDHIGAVTEFLKKFNVSVYGTHFTISILENKLAEAGMPIKDYRLYRINEEKFLKFKDVRVEFYNVSHSIPEAINIAIITKDGVIVYAPDFTFGINSDKKYHISFNRINDIMKYGVLALASESIGTVNVNRTKNNIELDHAISKALDKKQRTFFTVYSTEIEKIQRIVNICVKKKRRIAFIGRNAQKILSFAMERNYLIVPKENLAQLKFIDDVNKNEDKDLAIIIAGARHEPFYMLLRMCNGGDRLIQLKKNDEILMVCSPLAGTERIAQSAMSAVLEHGANIDVMNKNSLVSSHASSDDLSMLYAMLRPKYVIPIIGEYRHQYIQKNIAIDAGIPKERIIMLENGDVCEFNDGVYKKGDNKVECGDVLVDGSIVGDINNVVLKDREVLSEEGVIFVSIPVSTKWHQIVADVEVVSKGFMANNIEEFRKDLSEISLNMMEGYLRKTHLDLNKASEYIKEKISNYILKQSQMRPIVVVTIVDIK